MIIIEKKNKLKYIKPNKIVRLVIIKCAHASLNSHDTSDEETIKKNKTIIYRYNNFL
jgi:hypothetical protein